MLEFDWYQASIPDLDESELLAELKGHYELSDIKKGRALYGYKEAVDLVRGEHKICSVMWGLSASPDPHITFTSSDAIEGSEFIRKRWPNHKVSRVDTALDWEWPSAWDELSTIALDVANQFGVSVQHVGDFTRGEKGRTLYFGSKSSNVFICLYEKGKQPAYASLGYTDWVRLEVRVRPSSKSKGQCAAITPPEVFGCAKWTQELYRRVSGVSVARRKIGTVYKPSDDDRAFDALIKQYGQLIVRQLITQGSDKFIKRLLWAVNWECPF